MNLFFKLKVLFWHPEKKSITIQPEVKIPTLLQSILGQSTTSTRPMQIYMDVGVSLLRFKYAATLKHFTQTFLFSSKIHPFP